MRLETKFAKEAESVARQDLARRPIRIKRKSDRQQTAHEMRIAVAAIVKHRLARCIDALAEFEPHLADAAANLVRVVVGGFAQRLQRAAEVENVAVAVFPILKEGKIATN